MNEKPTNSEWSRVRIRLEKPTAVTFADAPAIEIMRNSRPDKSNFNLKSWEEATSKTGTAERVPFPLTGRLDEWLASQGHETLT
jgi:hypothetical protein